MRKSRDKEQSCRAPDSMGLCDPQNTGFKPASAFVLQKRRTGARLTVPCAKHLESEGINLRPPAAMTVFRNTFYAQRVR